ncbi:unnamed protein product [Fusarium graminearum]|uniref:Uncharacterized protein n=1 Tax=Gibberella zeae TaxID=5518 RepID=A0A2H3GCJ3_GIBZA|nr:hypothetical protein FGRA07_03570 [Fusarium graminearum]CAG2006397.1 unnamed protein product [Fusarium graminearum]CAG2014890.1 unnamed protein product [Fusarium graminearum]CZS82856.1 unnamed protein product [Fusarium graminearum]
MKYLLLLLFTLTTFADATFPVLARRQDSCNGNTKVCGVDCILKSYTCCPSPFYGGCAPGTVCGTDHNGTPGCCPIGKVCLGEVPTGTDNQPAIVTDKVSDNSADSGTANNNAGASDRIDGTAYYFMVGALALLF